MRNIFRFVTKSKKIVLTLISEFFTFGHIPTCFPQVALILFCRDELHLKETFFSHFKKAQYVLQLAF